MPREITLLFLTTASELPCDVDPYREKVLRHKVPVEVLRHDCVQLGRVLSLVKNLEE